MEAGERDVTNASTADVPTSINTKNIIKDEMLIAETPGRVDFATVRLCRV